MRIPLLATLLLGATALPAAAQSRWKQIGMSTTNPVYINPKTVKTVKGITYVTVRVKYVPPVKTREGEWHASQYEAMFDCAKGTFANKQSTYYSDDAGTKVLEKTVNKKPGFGVILGGSAAQIAKDYVCKKK